MSKNKTKQIIFSGNCCYRLLFHCSCCVVAAAATPVSYFSANILFPQDVIDEDGSAALEVLGRVQTWVARGSRLQWMSKYAHTKDFRYMTALGDMIDTWSITHAAVVVAVCAGQVGKKRQFLGTSNCQK